MRTIFGKQLLLYLGTLIVSFVLLGAALSQVIRNYFTQQRIAYLTDSGRRIAAVLEDYGSYGVIDLRWLGTQISAIQQYLNAQLVVINTDYQVTVSRNKTELSQSVYTKELEPLMEGQTVVMYGNLNNLFSEPLLTVGYPMKWDEHITGAILVSSSMAELDNTINGMYRITLLCLGISALVAFSLIYFSCRAISKPLRQMNEAAGVIADGDFEKRITVHSRDEVGQLAARFNAMAESLQEQEKIRRAFIANLSHDLRSPLTSMRGFLQAISDGTVPPEKQPHYLDIILDESERLIKLSNDVLDINMIQEADVRLTASVFDINELIRTTLTRFETRSLEKELKITCQFAHETDWVRADADKIQRVLYNLLDNAIKFTPEITGEIMIETTVTGKKVAVGVQDNGRGMDASEQKRIFDRFYKGDTSRGEDKKGSGLGLSIVKEFIRAHGENITVTSEPGQGSLFVFTLSLAEE